MKSEKLKVRKAFGKWSFGMIIGYLAFIFSLFTFHFSLFTTASAQDDQTEIAPPPLKLVAKSELTRLDAQSDAKARTKLALELMSERLTAAEKLNAAQDFTGVFRELGDFQGLMDNSLARDKLGFVARTSLAEGLKRTLAWYRANKAV